MQTQLCIFTTFEDKSEDSVRVKLIYSPSPVAFPTDDSKAVYLVLLGLCKVLCSLSACLFIYLFFFYFYFFYFLFFLYSSIVVTCYFPTNHSRRWILCWSFFVRFCGFYLHVYFLLYSSFVVTRTNCGFLLTILRRWLLCRSFFVRFCGLHLHVLFLLYSSIVVTRYFSNHFKAEDLVLIVPCKVLWPLPACLFFLYSSIVDTHFFATNHSKLADLLCWLFFLRFLMRTEFYVFLYLE